MLPRETKKYLFDIAEACDLIAQFTKGKSFSDYLNDPMLRSAVERQFEIIGEALKKAVETSPEIEMSISNSSRIIAFRNRLIHAYATVADEVVWGVLESHLPVLTREVTHLLEDPEEK
jgi:uncharacterized protein with HEPN domain